VASILAKFFGKTWPRTTKEETGGTFQLVSEWNLGSVFVTVEEEGCKFGSQELRAVTLMMYSY
jgi:hypothetical protein